MFKPRVHPCSVTEDGETFEFFVREPSGREILVDAEKAKGKDRSTVDNGTDIFAKYVVHQDGSALSKEEVEELLAMRASAMNLVSEQVLEKTGIRRMMDGKKA